MGMLADMYEKGDGVVQDLSEAKKLREYVKNTSWYRYDDETEVPPSLVVAP